MRTKLTLLGLALVALGALVFSPEAEADSLPAGVKDPTQVMVPDDVMSTYHYGPYNATTGALFDAGYATNSLGATAYLTSIEGAQALVAAECEARMVRNGVNNATSNIISFGDDSSGRKLDKIIISTALVDAGAVVSHGGAVTGLLYWRPLSGGDAGMPWQLVRAVVYTVGSAQAATSLNPGLSVGFMDVEVGNGTTASVGASNYWAPGYYCFLPAGTAPGYGVSHIWQRLNRVFVPR